MDGKIPIKDQHQSSLEIELGQFRPAPTVSLYPQGAEGHWRRSAR